MRNLFLVFILFFFTNLQANLVNPNFNLGYTLSTSAETNNRQLHKDEEKWLDDNVDRFIEQEAKEGKFYSQQEARALLYHSANSMVDDKANLNIGGDLNLISQRDKYQSNSKSSSIGANVGFSGYTNKYHFANGNLQTSYRTNKNN